MVFTHLQNHDNWKVLWGFNQTYVESLIVNIDNAQNPYEKLTKMHVLICRLLSLVRLVNWFFFVMYNEEEKQLFLWMNFLCYLVQVNRTKFQSNMKRNKKSIEGKSVVFLLLCLLFVVIMIKTFKLLSVYYAMRGKWKCRLLFWWLKVLKEKRNEIFFFDKKFHLHIVSFLTKELLSLTESL